MQPIKQGNTTTVWSINSWARLSQGGSSVYRISSLSRASMFDFRAGVYRLEKTVQYPSGISHSIRNRLMTLGLFRVPALGPVPAPIFLRMQPEELPYHLESIAPLNRRDLLALSLPQQLEILPFLNDSKAADLLEDRHFGSALGIGDLDKIPLIFLLGLLRHGHLTNQLRCAVIDKSIETLLSYLNVSCETFDFQQERPLIENLLYTGVFQAIPFEQAEALPRGFYEVVVQSLAQTRGNLGAIFFSDPDPSYSLNLAAIPLDLFDYIIDRFDFFFTPIRNRGLVGIRHVKEPFPALVKLVQNADRLLVQNPRTSIDRIKARLGLVVERWPDCFVDVKSLYFQRAYDLGKVREAEEKIENRPRYHPEKFGLTIQDLQRCTTQRLKVWMLKGFFADLSYPYIYLVPLGHLAEIERENKHLNHPQIARQLMLIHFHNSKFSKKFAGTG